MGGALSFGPMDTDEKVANMLWKKKYDMQEIRDGLTQQIIDKKGQEVGLAKK